MGQLVLSSFLSPLMSGGRKFKSNVTGCTLSVFSRRDIEKAMGKSTKKKGSESNEGRRRYVAY